MKFTKFYKALILIVLLSLNNFIVSHSITSQNSYLKINRKVDSQKRPEATSTSTSKSTSESKSTSLIKSNSKRSRLMETTSKFKKPKNKSLARARKSNKVMKKPKSKFIFTLIAIIVIATIVVIIATEVVNELRNQNLKEEALYAKNTVESLYFGKMKTCTNTKIKSIEARYIILGSLLKIAAFPRTDSSKCSDCTEENESEDCMVCNAQKDLLDLEKESKDHFTRVDKLYDGIIDNACTFEKDDRLVAAYNLAMSEIDNSPIWLKILNVVLKILGGASTLAKGKIAENAKAEGVEVPEPSPPGNPTITDVFADAFKNKMADSGTPISEKADVVITGMSDKLSNISSLKGTIETLPDDKKDEFTKANSVVSSTTAVITLLIDMFNTFKDTKHGGKVGAIVAVVVNVYNFGVGIKTLIEYFSANPKASIIDKIKVVWDFLGVIKDLSVAIFEMAVEFGKGKSLGPVVYLASAIVEFIKSLFSFADAVKKYIAQQKRFEELKEYGENKLKELEEETKEANCQVNITNYEISLDAIKTEETLKKIQESLPEEEISTETRKRVYNILKINPRFSLMTEKNPGDLKKFISDEQYQGLKNVADEGLISDLIVANDEKDEKALKSFGYLKVTGETEFDKHMEKRSLWYCRGCSGVGRDMTFIRSACVVQHNHTIMEKFEGRSKGCSTITHEDIRKLKQNGSTIKLKKMNLTFNYMIRYIEETGNNRGRTFIELQLSTHRVNKNLVMLWSYANVQKGMDHSSISNWFFRPDEGRYVPVPLGEGDKLNDLAKNLTDKGCSEECDGTSYKKDTCPNYSVRYNQFCKECSSVKLED